MITGERPFAGDSLVTTALAHVSMPAPPLPEDVPEPLRTAVMAALAKDPTQRPQSAVEFAEALRTPPEELPDTLRIAAASAVAPVVVGVPIALPPDAPLPTSIISTPEATIITPPGMTPIPMGARGVVGSAPGTHGTHGTQGTDATDATDPGGRQVRRLLIAAAVVVVVIVVASAIAFGGSRTAGDQLPASSPSVTPAVAASSASATGAPTTSTTSTTSTISTAGGGHSGTPAKGHGKGKGGKGK
jgi:serine/threonine-protein kinase